MSKELGHKVSSKIVKGRITSLSTNSRSLGSKNPKVTDSNLSSTSTKDSDPDRKRRHPDEKDEVTTTPKRFAYGVKQEIRSIKMHGAPIRSVFLIHNKYHKINEISNEIYDAMRTYDNRFVAGNMRRADFLYIHKIAVFVRLYQIAQESGYFSSQHYPHIYAKMLQLKKVRFPMIIAQYIECIGRVHFESLNIYPYVPTVEDYLDEYEGVILHRPLGSNVAEFIPFDRNDHTVYQALNAYPIEEYITCTSRVEGYTHSFRTVNWDTLDGTNELLVSRYRDLLTQTSRGVSTINLDEETFAKGVIFEFWEAVEAREFGDTTQFPNRYISNTQTDLAVDLARWIQDCLAHSRR